MWRGQDQTTEKSRTILSCHRQSQRVKYLSKASNGNYQTHFFVAFERIFVILGNINFDDCGWVLIPLCHPTLLTVYLLRCGVNGAHSISSTTPSIFNPPRALSITFSPPDPIEMHTTYQALQDDKSGYSFGLAPNVHLFSTRQASLPGQKQQILQSRGTEGGMA